MSKRSETNLQGIPMKPYDLLREGIVMFTLCAVVILMLAILLGAPDYPAVRAEDVARRQPLAYLKTCANILAGNSDLSGYGPPYTPDRSKAQRFLGIAPANWFGVAIPLDPPRDFILKPLVRAAILDETMAPALKTFEAAKPAQRQAWVNTYLAGLNKATIVRGQAQLPAGNYGPVPVLMDGMLNLGRSGLLECALESNARLPYTLDFTRSLLFFQDDVYHGVAQNLDMLGE
ncbi:MAG TPA: hypothetical protein VHR86_09650, partial [Armatimonadota bacterium]|nr:hypothetical protein [Armatimonadota bacterium]